MTREGWICPRCKLSLAPHVNFCDCRDKGDEAGQPAVPVITPDTPGGGISVTPPMDYTVTNIRGLVSTSTTAYALGLPCGTASCEHGSMSNVAFAYCGYCGELPVVA